MLGSNAAAGTSSAPAIAAATSKWPRGGYSGGVCRAAAGSKERAVCRSV